MGYYSEYLNMKMDLAKITSLRKEQLKTISKIRGGRDILVYASDLMKQQAATTIEYTDLLAVHDQLANLKGNGNGIDVIIETPGGSAEVVEDLVRLVRGKHEKLGVIIPGYAKSAGTIFAMAADEILMGDMSALGPIDAQIISNGKRFSAEAYLEGLEKIKRDVLQTQKLNLAYIPMLQNISPGEIQNCENAQNFSKSLVEEWLVEYRFKGWGKHSSTGEAVTDDEKKQRAQKIAEELCRHSRWLTHARSLKIKDLEGLQLEITDYSKDHALNEAINRYYTLLRMTFDTNIYKVFETIESQIYRFSFVQGQAAVQERQIVHQGGPTEPKGGPTESKGSSAVPKGGSAEPQGVPKNEVALIDYTCNICNTMAQIQVNLERRSKLKRGAIPFPMNNILICSVCRTRHNLSKMIPRIESESGKKVVR